jgi:tripartite-type tricarboxylate transporter receptor subunit TctC
MFAVRELRRIWVRALSFGLVLVSAVALGGAGGANGNESFAGKSIRFVVGVGVGGGFDIYSRVIARHLGRHIPGNPNIVVENMPGAGGGRAATYMHSMAPKDGTAIAALMPGTIANPLLVEGPPVPYDAAKLVYLGSADSGTRMCVTTRKSGLSTFEDAQTKETVVGALAAGSSTYDYAYLIKNMAGARFKVVSGYTATSEITLAMDRGEVQALCGWDWSSLQSQQPDYAKKYHLVLQTAVRPNAELDGLGIPEIRRFVKSESDRSVIDLVLTQQLFGRPFVAPTGTPAPVTRVLRNAFDATLKDKAFLNEAAKARLQILPADGAAVQEAVEKLYASPKAVVDRAKQAMKP